jgi:YD repeat-containing protein
MVLHVGRFARRIIKLTWKRALALAVCASVFGSVVALAQTAPLTPPKVITVSPTNVSMATTTYVESVGDISIGSLKLERTYLGGQEMSNHLFGWRWTHNFDMWAYTGVYGGKAQTKVVLGRETHSFGAVAVANPTLDGTPDIGEDGNRVEVANGGILFTDRDGVRYQFDSPTQGKIASITAPDGELTTFSYASGKPKTVVSNRGYALVFDYDGAGNISAACGFNRAVTYVTTSTTCVGAALKTTYSYTGGVLTGATNVSGYTTTYAYDGLYNLTCLTDPGSSTCKVTNTYRPGTNQISQQTFVDGSVWQFNCTCVYGTPDAEEFQDDGSGWTDPSGVGKAFSFQNGVLNGYWDENSLLHEVSYYGGQLVRLKMPEGNEWEASLTSRGIVSANTFRPKPGFGASNIVQDIKTFPAGACTNRVICNKPLTVTDARGNQTSFTYDQTHGGVLTETRPANNAGVQAVVRHAYISRTAWVSNGGGGYSAEAAIWLPSEDRICKTGATNVAGNACVNGAADEVVSTYEYGPNSGPNTLLPRGKAITAEGITLRVCYAYDAQGNKISETNARAGLASCP